ncbi:hypothetical protein RUND412_004333 [Rhizina undulata]
MTYTSTPKYIFVVRHGARLDMADSQWVLTSPTPYDPPLTYGGWNQARSVGMRIATLIHQQLATNSIAISADGKRRAKKTRFVIHSSPFTRCVQTSVSIASGIAQHHHQTVTNAHYVDANGNFNRNPITPPESSGTHSFTKPLLRLDAWLGEWLNPDYFADITPPPPVPVLIGTAKTDYLRPSSQPAVTNTAFSMSSIANALPASHTGGYVPPSPTWAISSNGQIPRGYVSHAKEYVEFDLGWDSFKIGQGGEYGEEWAAMLKRFRNDYKKLMWYYAVEDPKVSSAPIQWKRSSASRFGEDVKKHTAARAGAPAPLPGTLTPPLLEEDLKLEDDEEEEEEDDDEIETVLILVTHGAGCNALIGALTDRPVFVDVGIASVTYGIRQHFDPTPTVHHHKVLHHHSHSMPIRGDLPEPPVKYDLKLVANTEHLRSGSPASTPPISPNLTSLNRTRNVDVPTLGRWTLSSSGIAGGSLGSALGGVHWAAGTGSVGAAKGLWSRPTSSENRPESRDEFSASGWLGAFTTDKEEAVEDKEEAIEDKEEEQSSGWVKGTGLWGTTAEGGVWERQRRWTVSRTEF